MEQEERIELRSEKVRNVIRQKPPFLVRWGTLIVLIVLLLLCYMAYSYMQWMKEGILCSCFSQGIRCKVPLLSCVRSILTNCWLQSTDLLTPVNRVADSMSTGLLTLCQQLKDSINSFVFFYTIDLNSEKFTLPYERCSTKWGCCEKS